MKNTNIIIRCEDQEKREWKKEALTRGTTLTGLIVDALLEFLRDKSVYTKPKEVKKKPIIIEHTNKEEEFRSYFKE